MITIISGSNRKNNKTLPFAKSVFAQLQKQGHQVKLLDLGQLSNGIISEEMYDKSNQPLSIEKIQDEYFMPAEKFWFFVPEYNGSYPGVLKVLIDVMSTRDQDQTFKGKKACLTGVALGRAGNLRGMDHLAEVLNHVGIIVHPNKKPISAIFQFINDKNELDPKMEQELERQVSELVAL